MSSLLVIAPLPRFGSGNVTALVAVPCQLISAWQVPACRSMVRVISLITARISCLRWLLVVAGASNTARMSAPARVSLWGSRTRPLVLTSAFMRPARTR